MSHKILEELLKSKGASLVGFCKLDASPIKNQPHLRYAISIAVKLSDSVLRTIDKRPSIMYFQHYRTVNYKLDQICLDCVKYLEDKGFDAFPIAGSQSKPTDKFSGV
ncbi:MAG: epoxyqueuosine reductase, partial [Clostridia bacterium]|nr:epoxyqueuosine reductase [Clostridia bacterium]